MTIFLIAIMVGASLYNFHRSQLDFREELRASVRSLAERYAEEISRQIRMSTRSLEALEAAIKIDDAGMTDKHFDELAQSLIGSIMGISALGLAPGGCLTKTYPPDKFAAVEGEDLLLHPQRGPQAVEAILARTTYIDDIVDATGGAPGPPPGASPGQRPDFTFEDRPDFVARRPIFTSYAPVFMPDSWIMLFGQNFSRQCSGTDYPAEVPNCYFPGPPDVHGKATHFWGFAVMSVSFEDLLRTIDLASLETGLHRVGGFTKFSYQLSSATMTADSEALERWPRSNSSLDAEPESSFIEVSELSLHWKLELAPVDGWEEVDPNTTYVLLLLPLSALIGVCLGMDVILALRKHSQQEVWKMYMGEVRARIIQSAISNLNVVQFPFCVVCIEDFEKFGMILRHETVRDRGLLHSIDTAEAAVEFCRLDGVVFISHQWAGYSHPDPYGTKYEAIGKAVRELQRRGVRANWIWLDYCCIPQENNVQQQSAINSMFAYASFCTTFLSLAPTCTHVDSGEELTAETRHQRLWCLLELLCFTVSRAGRHDEAFLYTDDGLDEDEPLSEQALGVMNGTSTCCQLCHASSNPCDKQRVVSVMLGIYWRLLVLKQKRGGTSAWAMGMLEQVDANEESFFPGSVSLLDEGGTSYEVDLFEGYLPALREMFEEDAEQFLAGPGVSDPCAFAGTTSVTVSKSLGFGRSNSQLSASITMNSGSRRQSLGST